MLKPKIAIFTKDAILNDYEKRLVERFSVCDLVVYNSQTYKKPNSLTWFDGVIGEVPDYLQQIRNAEDVMKDYIGDRGKCENTGGGEVCPPIPPAGGLPIKFEEKLLYNLHPNLYSLFKNSYYEFGHIYNQTTFSDGITAFETECNKLQPRFMYCMYSQSSYQQGVILVGFERSPYNPPPADPDEPESIYVSLFKQVTNSTYDLSQYTPIYRSYTGELSQLSDSDYIKYGIDKVRFPYAFVISGNTTTQENDNFDAFSVQLTNSKRDKTYFKTASFNLNGNITSTIGKSYKPVSTQHTKFNVVCNNLVTDMNLFE